MATADFTVENALKIILCVKDIIENFQMEPDGSNPVIRALTGYGISFSTNQFL